MGDSQVDSYVLGLSFLSSYVSIFDLDNKRVGLATPGSNPHPQPVPPTPDNKKKLKTWVIVAISVGSLLLILAVVLVVLKIRRDKINK